MIKVDLITGFLGAGKTTFIKKYAKYFTNQGQKIGILENDFGAVNVDMLLLNELRSDKCELEMVAGGCDMECHRRRFKTKLISMAMSGYNRVIIEPSGLFDMDEFFDALREEPLDNWYSIGNVIVIAEAKCSEKRSEDEQFIYENQLSYAGRILLSKVEMASEEEIERTISDIAAISERLGCKRKLDKLVISKSWDELDEKDMRKIADSDYQITDSVKKSSIEELGFSTLYFLEHGLDIQKIKAVIDKLFGDITFGNIWRIKGFVMDNGDWYEINATKSEITINPVPVGQEVLIVIGRKLNEDNINSEVKKQCP